MGSKCTPRDPIPARQGNSGAGPVPAGAILHPSHPCWQQAPSVAPRPCALTGADPSLVPQTPHLKQTPLCPRLSCWDGHGLRRQQSQSPGEGPSGCGQKGGQVELTPQTRSPPPAGPPQATLTLLSVTVCCSQITISSMEDKLGRAVVAAGRPGGSDWLWLLFAAAGPFLNPTSGCNKEQQQS